MSTFGGGDKKGTQSTFSFGASTAAPAATPTFSFGAAAPAPASTSSAPSAAPATSGVGLFGTLSKPPAAAGSTFSFGGGAASTAAPAPTPSGAFSFGNTPAPAPAAPVTGSSTPASTPAQASAAGSFSFGAPSTSTSAPAPATVFSFAASTPGTAAAPAPAPSSKAADPPAAAAPVAPAASSSAPAPAPAAASTGGFSFGAPAPAPASSAAQAPAASSTGGLSFGAVSGEAPAAAPTPSSAPDQTSRTSTGDDAGTAAGGASSAKSGEDDKPLGEYMTMTVEEIVKSWNAQLDQDAMSFTNEACKVAEWDKGLRETQGELLSLADDVQKLVLGQQDLERGMKTVEGEQAQLNKTLDQLESQADKLIQEQRGRMPEEGDVEREQTHFIAETVDNQLATMVDTLKSLVDQVNASSSSHLGGGDRTDSNTRKIVRILNAHHHSLAWLEESSKNMLMNVSDARRRLGVPYDAVLTPP